MKVLRSMADKSPIACAMAACPLASTCAMRAARIPSAWLSRALAASSAFCRLRSMTDPVDAMAPLIAPSTLIINLRAHPAVDVGHDAIGRAFGVLQRGRRGAVDESSERISKKLPDRREHVRAGRRRASDIPCASANPYKISADRAHIPRERDLNPMVSPYITGREPVNRRGYTFFVMIECPRAPRTAPD